jgi:hypothetical protein
MVSMPWSNHLSRATDLLLGRFARQFPPEGDPGYVVLRVGGARLGIAHVPDAMTDGGGQRSALAVSTWARPAAPTCSSS